VGTTARSDLLCLLAYDATVPSRHELPDIDAPALEAARAVDRLLAEAVRTADAGPGGDARASAADRWAGYFQRIPDQLRDAPLPELRATARRARSAFGPKDSVRDALDPSVTEPVVQSIDRLLRAIARYESHRS
jgi:hypothetical protein